MVLAKHLEKKKSKPEWIFQWWCRFIFQLSLKNVEGCVELNVCPEREKSKRIALLIISKGMICKQYQYLLSSFVYSRIVTKKET